MIQDFTQLVGGVIWLLRDGETYVDEAKKVECPDGQETGQLNLITNDFLCISSLHSSFLCI